MYAEQLLVSEPTHKTSHLVFNIIQADMWICSNPGRAGPKPLATAIKETPLASKLCFASAPARSITKPLRRCSKEQSLAKTRVEKREIKGITIFMEPLNNYHPKWVRNIVLL